MKGLSLAAMILTFLCAAYATGDVTAAFVSAVLSGFFCRWLFDTEEDGDDS
jgi:hypothetical protein